MDSPVDAKQCALRLATYFLGLAIICTDYDRVASNPHPLQVHFANLCRLVSTLGLSVLYIESKISSLWCANDEFLFLIWLSAVDGSEGKIQLVWLHFSLFFSFPKWLPQNSSFETPQCGHCADWFWLAPCRSRMWRAKFHLVHMATFRRSVKWRRTRWQKAVCHLVWQAWLYWLFIGPLISPTNLYTSCGTPTLNFIEQFGLGR